MWITQNGKVWYSEAEYKELEQALEEIREIVEFAIEEVLTVSQKNATDIILNTINEVLNNGTK